MDKKKENRLKNKTRKLSIIEGSFYSVHEGFGIRYITPFALVIGKNNPYTNAFIGILNSLPTLIGDLSQLYTYNFINGHGRKKLIASSIILQSIMWFGIILSGLLFFIFNYGSTFSLITLTIFCIFLINL